METIVSKNQTSFM